MATPTQHSAYPKSGDLFETAPGWRAAAGLPTNAAGARTARTRKRAAQRTLENVIIFSIFAAVIVSGVFAWLFLIEGDRPPVSPDKLRFVSTINDGATVAGTGADSRGFITKEWLLQRLRLGTARPLSTKDIETVLAGVGQIREVKRISVKNGEAVVEIVERKPQLRVEHNGKTLLVDADGTVFDGIGYDSRTERERLPLLFDAQLTPDAKSDAGDAPVKSVSDGALAATLLRCADDYDPRLRYQWRSVSVREVGGGVTPEGACLRVRRILHSIDKTRAHVSEILFSAAPDAFREELRIYTSREFRRIAGGLLAAAPAGRDYVLDLSSTATGNSSPHARMPRLIPREELIPAAAPTY